MLISQFILQNIHFALALFASLVFFSVSWLYFDAYLISKSAKDIFKIVGFCLLSLSFLVSSTIIEQTILLNPVFNQDSIQLISNLTAVLGFLCLVFGLFTDKIEKKPEYKQAPAYGLVLAQNLPIYILAFSFPVLSFVVFLLLLRRTTIGLEKHLKPLTTGFFFIFLYELFALFKLLQDTGSIYIYKIVKPFGPLWIFDQVLLLVAVIIIAKWIFGYLLKRIQTQLFMILNVLILAIFLITTITFATLLLGNFREGALSNLSMDVNVINYAFQAKAEKTLSDAQLIAENQQVKTALVSKDKKTLKNLATGFLLSQNQSSVILLSSSGAVLARGEDNDKIGDSFSSELLFVKATRGEKVSSFIARDGVVAPVILIESAVPVVQDGIIIGVVINSTEIDNAFLDGLKQTTKLDVSIYGGNVLSATTFIAEDGKSRFIGVKENNPNVRKTVLIGGKNYSLDFSLLNNDYFATFSPLKDINGNTVGMIFAGKEQTSIIQEASRSIEITFLVSAFLIFISILPAYIISKFIANQFK